MRNPFKRNKEPKLIFIEVPLGAFAKMVAFDASIADPQTVTDILGFPQMSDDVAEMELEASKLRLEALAPLGHLLLLHSTVVSETMALYQQRVATEAPLDEEDVNDLRRIYQTVALTSTISALSVLSSYGLVDVMGKSIGISEDVDE